MPNIKPKTDKRKNAIRNVESKSKKNIEEPLIQYAQKCAWCGEYITDAQETELYSGSDNRYKFWLCHKGCNT